VKISKTALGISALIVSIFVWGDKYQARAATPPASASAPMLTADDVSWSDLVGAATAIMSYLTFCDAAKTPGIYRVLAVIEHDYGLSRFDERVVERTGQLVLDAATSPTSRQYICGEGQRVINAMPWGAE